MSLGTRSLLAFVAVLALVTAVAADPPVRLVEDGTVLLYRSQPGDLPGAVAEAFGVSDLPPFLAANGIKDPHRVAAGHVYRILNPLAARAFEAEARATALSAETAAARARVRELETEVAALTARAAELEQRSASLARAAGLWPWARLLIVALVLGIAAAGWLAHRSVGALQQAERYAGRLADEADERRRAALAERQESARRILKLEDEVRSLEHEVARGAAHRRPTGTH